MSELWLDIGARWVSNIRVGCLIISFFFFLELFLSLIWLPPFFFADSSLLLNVIAPSYSLISSEFRVAAMPPLTFSRLVDVEDSKLARWPWSKKPKTGTKRPSTPRLSRKRDIFVAFFVVSFPLLVIAILLLAFIFASDREKPASYVEPPAPFPRVSSIRRFLYQSSPRGFFAGWKLGKYCC